MLSLLALNTLATNTIKNSVVTDVTIYRSYAKETRIGSIQVPEGNSEVVITNITQHIDENSIQVGCRSDIKLLSVSTRLNYIVDEHGINPNKIKVWQDSIKLLDKKSRFMAKQKEAYETELSILNANTKLGSEHEGLKAAHLKELLDLNRSKQAELKKLIFDIDEEYNEYRNMMATLQNQVNQHSTNAIGKPVREIVLKLFSNSENNTSFKVSYLVTTAGWTPTYELRCENTNKPLMINCRAKITQNTGFDWKNVRIKLSTANPTQNHNRPILYPLFVDFMQPDYYQAKLKKTTGYGEDYVAKEAPAVQMMSNMAYGKSNEEFKDGMKLDEKAVTVTEGDMMVEYELEQKQDIESDGKEHIVAIQEITLPATYNYHTVPKLDNGVFLLARVTDWGKYNLLAGEATLFFDDMYIGKSYLNPHVSTDTLFISLGRDEKINVKRTKLLELCSTKKFSSKKKEVKAYETMIKNNKNIPIEIELLDQIPLARHTDIEVELEEAEGAEITKEYGKVLWKLKLQPGETRKVKIVYSIKFPDDKRVVEKN